MIPLSYLELERIRYLKATERVASCPTSPSTYQYDFFLHNLKSSLGFAFTSPTEALVKTGGGSLKDRIPRQQGQHGKKPCLIEQARKYDEIIQNTSCPINVRKVGPGPIDFGICAFCNMHVYYALYSACCTEALPCYVLQIWTYLSTRTLTQPGRKCMFSALSISVLGLLFCIVDIPQKNVGCKLLFQHDSCMHLDSVLYLTK